LSGTQDILLSALVSVANMALMVFAAHFVFKKADLK
jgi:hypothetical protein